MKIRKQSQTGPMELPTARIHAAEVNVHARECGRDETFRGLVESIRHSGMIHRIVVRADPSGTGDWIVVDGHRRLAAAKAAGLDMVPVEVRDTKDAESALEITVAANVQREGNDPLLEAVAIDRMMRAGRTREEVAAAIGKSPKYVERRARLMNLTEAWRKFAKRTPCTTDLLERVAACEADLQNRVAAEACIAEIDTEDRGVCGWGDFEDAFRKAMMDLEDAAFDTACCAECASNTRCHGFLFDFLAKDGRVAARCEDPACYIRRNNSAVHDQIAGLRAKGRPAVEVSSRWNIPENWSATRRPTRSNTQAYTFLDGPLAVLLWSVPKPARQMPSAEERAARKAERARIRTIRSGREKVRANWSRVSEGGVDAVRARLGASYAALAARRMERDIGRGWVDDEFLEDFAAVAGELALAGLDDSEREALTARTRTEA